MSLYIYHQIHILYLFADLDVIHSDITRLENDLTNTKQIYDQDIGKIKEDNTEINYRLDSVVSFNNELKDDYNKINDDLVSLNALTDAIQSDIRQVDTKY